MSTASDIVAISKELINDALALALKVRGLADTFLNAEAAKDKLDLDASIGRLQSMKTRVDSSSVNEAVLFSGDASALAVTERAISDRIVNKLKLRGIVSVVGEGLTAVGKAAGDTVAAALNPLLPVLAGLVGLALILGILYLALRKKA